MIVADTIKPSVLHANDGDESEEGMQKEIGGMKGRGEERGTEGEEERREEGRRGGRGGRQGRGRGGITT